MKKYIYFLLLFVPFINSGAFVRQDKIKTTWETKDGYYYMNLGSADGLREGSILIGSSSNKRPFFIEILGVLKPHYSLFQKIEFVWNDAKYKIEKKYLDKVDFKSELEVTEMYDSFHQLFAIKLKKTERLYNEARKNYNKKRFHLSKKYFEECCAIVKNYKESKEILNNLNNDLKEYKTKPELDEDFWKRSMSKVVMYKSEDKLQEALRILQKSVLDYPLSKKARRKLGLFYNELGYIENNDSYFKEAINEIEELLYLDQGSPDTLKELAFLYYYHGDIDKAMEHLEKLFTLSRGDAAVELRNLINKLFLISSRQTKSTVRDMCSLCLHSISGRGVRFSNRMILCDNCNEGRVHNRQDIKKYFKQIENVFREKYKMKIKKVKDYIPGDESALRKISNTNDKYIPFVFIKPTYTEYEVYYLDSLPRILVIEGLTSEYVRIWFEEQKLTGMNSRKKEEKLGIEMYFKYVMLNHFQLREQTERFVYENNSASLSFRRIQAIVKTKGKSHLVDYIKKNFQ